MLYIIFIDILTKFLAPIILFRVSLNSSTDKSLQLKESFFVRIENLNECCCVQICLTSLIKEEVDFIDINITSEMIINFRKSVFDKFGQISIRLIHILLRLIKQISKIILNRIQDILYIMLSSRCSNWWQIIVKSRHWDFLILFLLLIMHTNNMGWFVFWFTLILEI